jgi:hypothetical protein
VFRRFSALMLIALAFSPFTRPFSTCDLATFFHDQPTLDTTLTSSSAATLQLPDQASQPRWSEPPVFGRGRFAAALALSHTPVVAVDAISAISLGAAVIWPAAMAQPLRRPTALRI